MTLIPALAPAAELLLPALLDVAATLLEVAPPLLPPPPAPELLVAGPTVPPWSLCDGDLKEDV